MEMVDLARTVGVLLDFGFCGGVPVGENDPSLVCLDALLSVNGLYGAGRAADAVVERSEAIAPLTNKMS